MKWLNFKGLRSSLQESLNVFSAPPNKLTDLFFLQNWDGSSWWKPSREKHFWLFCSILALLWREHCDIFGPVVWHIVKWHLSYPLGVNEVFLTPRSTALTSMQTFFVTANVKIYVNILISDFYVQTVLRIEMAHSSLVNLIRDATIVIYDSRIVMTANL